MPLTDKNERYSESKDWFRSECSRDRDYHSEENEWNSRHAALFVNEWVGKGRPDYEWLGAGTLVAPSQIATCHFAGDHLKAHGEFGKFSGAVYYGTSLRVLDARVKAEELRYEFEVLSKRWERDTRHISLISKKVVHDSYLRIIGMGEAAIPLILESLRARPDHWFAALRATSNTDPSEPDDNPSTAREAWISWGIEQGYID